MEQDVKQIGEFHKNHDANIVLLEEGTVAYRKEGLRNGVVFTKYPISIGGLFEVKIEEIDHVWSLGLVSTNILEYIYIYIYIYMYIYIYIYYYVMYTN